MIINNFTDNSFTFYSKLKKRTVDVFRGIRFKLSVITFLLVILITTASSIIVINIMDRFVQRELIKQGFSMGRSLATASGYSLLSGDSLALDNLTSKLKEFREDMLFVTVTDNTDVIKAHSKIGETGKLFPVENGKILTTERDGSTVKKTERGGVSNFEFKIPILFAEKKLGNVYIGIDDNTLIVSQTQARKKIFFVSALVLVLGIVGTFFLSTFFTNPIKRLSEGVFQLSLGEYTREIPVVSKDELGELTEKFNHMAGIITSQKNKLQKYAKELEVAFVSTIRVLSAAIDARDKYTLGHSARVAQLSILLGERLGLTNEELKDLEMACLFHDVGKIRTPDHILHKGESLTKEEQLLMMKHPEDSADILMLVDSLHKHIPAVKYHHEWYNAKGYPEGLKGDEIPLFAAIISIVDAYDAMTTSRPYKKAKSKEEAIEELKIFSGKQFAPNITKPFIEVIEKYEINHTRTFLEVK
jgi:HD-GYP domain-containing protein (c-di-GMP phosphodiesterase class II)